MVRASILLKKGAAVRSRLPKMATPTRHLKIISDKGLFFLFVGGVTFRYVKSCIRPQMRNNNSIVVGVITRATFEVPPGAAVIEF